MGKVKVHSVIGDHLAEDKFPGYEADGRQNPTGNGNKSNDDDSSQARNIFLPMDHKDGSNPGIDVESPYPGVFLFRFSEGFNYPNANHYTDYLVETIFKETRRTNPNSYPRLGDRPWNNPGPRRGQVEEDHSDRPVLRAVVIDMSSVNNVDVTSIQNLIDVRNQLDRYATPDLVQWHFACINNRWTKRALASAGFGYPTLPYEEYSRWKPIFSVAEIGGSSSAAQAAELDENRRRPSAVGGDVEHARSGKPVVLSSDKIDKNSSNSSDDLDLQKEISRSKAYTRTGTKKIAVVSTINRPLFHIDLTSALQSAIANINGEEHTKGVGTETEAYKA